MISVQRLKTLLGVALVAFLLFLPSMKARARGVADLLADHRSGQAKCLCLMKDGRSIHEVEALADVFATATEKRYLIMRYARGRYSCDDSSAAQALVSNSVYRLARMPPVTLSKDISWSEDPFSSRTWQWALHSLFPVKQLLSGFEQTADVTYLTTAKELIDDWIEDNLLKPSPSTKGWNDHSTALRLIQFVIFWQYRSSLPSDSDFDKRFLQAICIHCEVLSLESFYSRHTNHGLDQSLSLYLAGTAFSEYQRSEEWRKRGLTRLKDEIAFMFTDEGVHKENSPSYHLWVLNTVRETIEMVGPDSRDEVIDDSLLEKTYSFLKYVTLPNRQFPLFGDSFNHSVNPKISDNIRGKGEILYSISQGQEGVRPNPLDTYAFFPESGYFFFREAWPSPSAFADAVYFAMKAKTLADYHRQADNLTISVYGYGERWICDSGRYLYEPADRFRKYMRGLRAHNVVVIDDAHKYSHRLVDKGRSTIVDYADSLEGAYVKSVMDYVSIGKHQRDVWYLKPGTFLLIDSVEGARKGDNHRYRLLFHIEPSKVVLRKTSGFIVKSTRRNDVWMMIYPIGEGKKYNGVIKGQTAPYVQGWTSFDGMTLTAAPVIYFDASGKAAQFVTLVFFGTGDIPSEVHLKERIDQQMSDMARFQTSFTAAAN